MSENDCSKKRNIRFLKEEYGYFYNINHNILTSSFWKFSNNICSVFLFFLRNNNKFYYTDNSELNSGNLFNINEKIEEERKLLESILKSNQWKLFTLSKSLTYYLIPFSIEELKIKAEKIRNSEFSTLLFNLFGEKLYKLFSILPINNNLVFLESHRGLSYSCNPKYLYLEIVDKMPDLKCVWSFAKSGELGFQGDNYVKRFSLKYYYYLATAKYLVHNAAFSPDIPFRPEQVYINTQHGTPLKKMGGEAHNVTEKAVENFLSDNSSKTYRWNLLVSPNQHSSEVFSRCYSYAGSITEFGYPRNDIFYSRDREAKIERIKDGLRLDSSKKIILYAPTWRDSKSKTIDRNFELKLDLEELYERFGSEYTILLRLHHLISSHINIPARISSFARDVSSQIYDMQELLLVADILITDYSSVMFDFANLDRHQIFYAYDYAEYVNSRRGVYFDLNEVAPGPVVLTHDELVESISAVEDECQRYSNKRKEFKERFCSWESGHAAEMLVQKVFVEKSLGHTKRPLFRKSDPQKPSTKKRLHKEILGVKSLYHPVFLHPFHYLKSSSSFVFDKKRSYEKLVASLVNRNYEKAVIFGNADCLNEVDDIDFSFFKDNNYLSIGLNRSIFKLNTDIVMWTDLMTISDILQDPRSNNKKTTYLHVKWRDHRYPVTHDQGFMSQVNYWKENKNFKNWDRKGLFLFRNILTSAFHLCYNLKVKEILLIGFDMESRNYFYKGHDHNPDQSYELRSDFQIEKLCHGYTTQKITREVIEYLVNEEGISIKYNGDSNFLKSISGISKVQLAKLG